MRFAFTEQQLELRAAVRSVLDRECTPADLRALASGGGEGPAVGTSLGRSAERWAVLSELGAPGIVVPEEAGGLGLTTVELVGVLEEAGWAALPEPLAESAGLAAALLVQVGVLTGDRGPAAARAGDLLAKVASGELVATVGGVDVIAGGVGGGDGGASAGGRAEQAGAVVTERVVGAGAAGLLLLAHRQEAGRRELHAVDASSALVTRTPSVDPTRDIGRVAWTPTAETLLASGVAADVLEADVADLGALSAAAELVGLADRMITLGADYAKVRQQFGRPIGSFQAVKHLLANARVRLEYARPAVYRASDSLARGVAARSVHASMAKALASDAADLAARVSLQVHGAIGYTWECDLHFFMKRAWALSGSWGDAVTHRARVLDRAIAGVGVGLRD